MLCSFHLSLCLRGLWANAEIKLRTGLLGMFFITGKAESARVQEKKEDPHPLHPEVTRTLQLINESGARTCSLIISHLPAYDNHRRGNPPSTLSPHRSVRSEIVYIERPYPRRTRPVLY